MSDFKISRRSGAAPELDSVAAAADPKHAFLRAAWFAAASDNASLNTVVARRSQTGEPVLALPLAARKIGILPLKEVPGSYWPFRSFPVAHSLSEAELAPILADRETRAALGHAWRIGPIYADDPTGRRLIAAARASGWTVLTRRLGTCYLLDLARRRAEGPWPSVKTLRKNRWIERRLAELGELEFRSFSGSGWSAEVMDMLAAIERESWVGRRGGDTKFLDPATRRVWEAALRDPALAKSLACTILLIGGEPAAFVFTLAAGSTLHCIANGYAERFAEHSSGRVLLYREFARAFDQGFDRIGWGAGDAGYKTEMGGEPGPEILDHLLVRGRILPRLLRPLWSRTSV